MLLDFASFVALLASLSCISLAKELKVIGPVCLLDVVFLVLSLKPETKVEAPPFNAYSINGRYPSVSNTFKYRNGCSKPCFGPGPKLTLNLPPFVVKAGQTPPLLMK